MKSEAISRIILVYVIYGLVWIFNPGLCGKCPAWIVLAIIAGVILTPYVLYALLNRFTRALN